MYMHEGFHGRIHIGIDAAIVDESILASQCMAPVLCS